MEKEGETPRFVRAEAVAEFLDLPVARVYELARERRLPGVIRIGERTVRFDLDQIEAWIRSGGDGSNEAS